MKKNTLEFYLSEMSSNGTNDLFVVDGNTGEIKATVDECTFGYPRNTRIKPDSKLGFGMECVESVDPDGSNPIDYEIDQALYSVDLDTLRKYFCVSPVDPNGANLDRRLKAAGIDLSKK